MVSVVATLSTVEARLHVQLKLGPASTSMSTLRAADLELACLAVKIQLRLTREDSLASLALEVIVAEMGVKGIVI